MTPEDSRHGTNAGYYAGCREACCRAGHAAYRRSVWRRRYVRGVDRLYADATGSKRRIRALQTMGYRLLDIDYALGRTPASTNVTFTANLLKQDRIHVDNAAKLAVVYEQMSMTTPVGRSVSRVSTMALNRGWDPPEAWPGSSIDDPDAKPQKVYARLDKVAEVEFLVGTDTPENISARLGYSDPANLARFLFRKGRGDLSRHFDNLRPHTKTRQDTAA